jgi:beta-lactamase class A
MGPGPAPPAPAGPAPRAGGRAAALQRRLEAAARHVPGRAAAIWWEDLDHGESVRIHAGTVFKAASLIKLPVAAATLALWERFPERRTPALERQLWKMVAESNNVAVDILAEHVGGLGAVNRFCREHGWRDTRMAYYFRQWRTRRAPTTTSARDMATLLRAVDRRELVSAAASEELWHLLTDQTMRHRIPAGIPAAAGATVGNKTGTLLAALHDVAIVHAPDTRYLLCILTANPRSEPAGDRYCRDVSRLVWETQRGGG